MPDPFVFPAVAALVGFIMSALSWYGMIRNGIDLVYNDLKIAKKYDSEIRDRLNEMEAQQKMISDWMTLWMVTEQTPESLFVEYWGNEYQKINDRLERLRDTMQEATKQLSAFTKLAAGGWRAMNSLERKWLKTSYIFIKRKYMRQLTEDVESKLSGIEFTANRAWKQKWSMHRRGAELDRSEVHEVHHQGICHLLVPLAINTWNTLDDLRESCRDFEESLRTELELDIFGASTTGSNSDYPKAIIAAAASEYIKIGILAQSHGGMSRVEVERVKREELCQLSGPEAFRSIVEGRQRRSSFIARENRFSVSSPSQNHQPNLQRRGFWTISPPNVIEVVRLGQSSQFRAAFELAQACLLFLNTAWFSAICTCELQCGELQSDSLPTEYEFALQTGHLAAHNPHLGNIQALNAGHTRLTKSVRRLGLMLIEIKHLATISSIECDERGRITRIELKRGTGSEILSHDGVFEDPSLPDLYSRALKYCMTTRFEEHVLPSPRLKELLKKFYEQVVKPLKSLYDQSLSWSGTL